MTRNGIQTSPRRQGRGSGSGFRPRKAGRLRCLRAGWFCPERKNPERKNPESVCPPKGRTAPLPAGGTVSWGRKNPRKTPPPKERTAPLPADGTVSWGRKNLRKTLLPKERTASLPAGGMLLPRKEESRKLLSPEGKELQWMGRETPRGGGGLPICGNPRTKQL